MGQLILQPIFKHSTSLVTSIEQILILKKKKKTEDKWRLSRVHKNHCAAPDHVIVTRMGCSREKLEQCIPLFNGSARGVEGKEMSCAV